MAQNVFADTNRSYTTASVASKQPQMGRAGSQTQFSNKLEQSRQELLSSHEQFMKKHLDAATKLSRRNGATLGERRPSSQLRARKEGGATNSRLRQNFNKILKEYGGDPPAASENADHNALKQFAMDQLSILSAKTSQRGGTAASGRTSNSEKRRRSGWDAHRKAMAAFSRKQGGPEDEQYQRNVDFLKDKEDRESAISSGKVPQTKARRLINLKAALFEENATSANSAAGGRSDDVAPRGGKDTLEAQKDVIRKETEEAFDEKRFKKFNMAQRVTQGEGNKLDRPYHKDMEKTNLCRRIRDRLRFEFQQMYRCSENAYAAMDRVGDGYVTKEAFMNSAVVKHRLPFTKDQLELYFVEFNLFARDAKGIDFDNFKKNFFPQHYLVQDPPDDFEDKQAQVTRNAIANSTEAGQQETVNVRVRKLEAKLKEKFSNYFESVQKAFLLLDQDYDGYITVEDMIKYFGNDNTLNYTDLKKLMTDKDSSKQGRLNYSDFSKWLGGAIHLQQGFFFRHDSRKNPTLEMFFEKDRQTKKLDDREEAARDLCDVPIDELRDRILRKMAGQWKTLRSCFMDINRAKNGLISEDEFRFYMDHWKFVTTPETFKRIFDSFDHDKDGFINYKDCARTIGPHMFPWSNYYFRIDNPQTAKVNCCKMDQCWQPTKNTQNYCELHQKMQSDISIGLFSSIFERVGEKWPAFVKKLKKVANPEDQSQLFVRDFKKVVRDYGGNVLSNEQFETIRLAFPGKERPDVDAAGNDDDHQTVNVVRLYDQKYSQIMEKIYKRVNVEEGGADEAQDFFGYLGRTKNYRRKVKLQAISYDEFYDVICAEPKLKKMIMAINSTQLNNKGEFIKGNYVTKAEMDDIIKELYPVLEGRELEPILSLYSLPQLKIIIDYRNLRDDILQNMAKRNDQNGGQKQPSNTQQKLQAKIDRLEDQIQKHKQNSEDLSKQLRDKFGVNRKALERLNASADETSVPSQYGYQKLSKNKLDRLNESRRSEAGSSVGKQRPKTTNQIRSNAPTFSQRQLVNDYNAVSKRTKKLARPQSQISKRSGSVDSRNDRTDTARMAATREEFVNIRNLIAGDKADPRLKTLRPSPNQEYMSPMKRASLAGPDDDDTIRYGSLQRKATVDDKPLTSARKASIDQRLNDYTEKMIEARRQQEGRALMEAEHYYADSKLSATDDSVMRKILSYTATRNAAAARTGESHRMDRAGTELSGDARAASPMVGLDFDASAKMHSSLIDPKFVNMAKGHRARDDGLITYDDQESLGEPRPRAASRPRTGGGHISPFARTPKGGSTAVSLERRASSNLRANERAIQSKLAYEWKNIYRHLMQLACERDTPHKKGEVTISEFNKACLRHHVNFTREELGNVRKVFGYSDDQGGDYIDFERLSHQFGLHRGSYDFFQRSFANNRSKSMYRLKQLYLSIEPVKEEIEEVESRDRTSRINTKRNSQQVSAMKQKKLSQRRTSTPTGMIHSNNMQQTVNQLAKTVNRQKLRRHIDTVRKTVDDKFSTAAEIKIALEASLPRFEKLVLLQLRKREIDSQIARNLGNDEDAVILPVTAFKTVLSQLGLRVSDNMLKRFIVKGDFRIGREGMSATPSQFDSKSKRSMSLVSKDLQNRTVKGSANQVMATVRQGGKTTLGIDVEGFVEHFTRQ